MLNNITWKQFIIAIGLIVLVYYVIVIALYYRDEFFKILRGQGRLFRQAELPEVDDDERLAARFEDRLEDSQAKTADALADHNDMMIGTVSDLMQEIKSLAQVIIENESSKEEAESFYRMLLSRYDQLAGTTYQLAINEALFKLLTEDMLFDLTATELHSWWPSPIVKK